MTAPAAVAPASLVPTIPARREGEAAADGTLDHETLFARGLARVQTLASRTWTDHNVHDPGITTLELLGYALTDLAYRANFPVEDLLAAEDGAAATDLCTARQILPARALTTADYRRLLIDLEGVNNAWILPREEGLFADTIRGVLRRDMPADPTGIVPIALGGLYDVRLEFLGGVGAVRRARVIAEARRVLNENRNLCEDFVDIAVVPVQRFVLCGEIELEADADVAKTQAAILFLVDQYLAPPVYQYSLAEMRKRVGADGAPYTVDQIFDGPALEHGFIDDAELAAAELRTELRLSDVISVIMDIDGVRAVRDVILSPAGADAPPDKWRLPVDDGRKPELAREASRLVFYKRNMPFVARTEQVRAFLDVLEAAAADREVQVRNEDLPVPRGRFRDPARYWSFQNHFPAVYGLSDVGLVGAVDERRPALALQLKAYLLFFDQLMADFCAQLANVRSLFSTDPEIQRTYFHQLVDSFADFDLVYGTVDVEALAAAIDRPGELIDRRNRFLDHLIARYAERFHEFADVMRTAFGTDAAALIRFKCDFLRDYPATSAARGLGYDHTRQDDAGIWNSLNVTGLERRLARLLGIGRVERRNLGDVAFELYPEIDTTPNDEFRFRVRHRNSAKIVLSSSTNYATREEAEAEMRKALARAVVAEGFARKTTIDGRFYFDVVDETGEVIARRIEYFVTEAEREGAISALMTGLTAEVSEEGMYVIENILLRPEQATDPLLPICPDPNCTDCADEDPYTYRINVILPAYGGRFGDMRFRRWAEEVIREEVPAHVLPKVCWINREDMADLERTYRDWLLIRSGRETANRARRIRDFVDVLYRVKTVYPARSLHDCDAPEAQPKFVLGQSALGSMRDTTDVPPGE